MNEFEIFKKALDRVENRVEINDSLNPDGTLYEYHIDVFAQPLSDDDPDDYPLDRLTFVFNPDGTLIDVE